MRRLLALSLVSFSVALGGAAGLAAPAAFAAGAGTGTGTTPGVVSGTTPAVSTVPAVPAPSLNLSNAGQNAVQPQTQPTPVVPATSTSTSSGGLSGLDAVLIAVIALLVLAGIAFYVWRDARGAVATLGHHASDDSMFARQHAGSKKPQKTRKHKVAERKRRKRGRAR